MLDRRQLDDATSDRLRYVIDELDDAVRDIRNTVFALLVQKSASGRSA